jgi:NADH-quinone oxidoreductase subunit L
LSGELQAPLLPWLLLMLAFPLASFVICFLVRPHYSWLTPIVSSLLMVAALIVCLVVFITRLPASPHFLQFDWTWFAIGTSRISASIIVDNYSLVMSLMVVAVSTLVHIFSAGYMVHDEFQARFFSLIGLFTFAMLGVVLSGNLFVLFCCWELVGATSYLLISHWRSREAAARAATKAFLFNRVGDFGFILGLAIVWRIAGTFDIVQLSGSDVAWTTGAGLFIFAGAMAKSAQLPLMTWLPDAMEGPTPVSALIHAATMVAAGVYVLIRLQFLFSPASLLVIAIVGSTTALYSGWLALRETDLKRILAYSTISQLSIMMIAIGMQAFDGAFLHLITHGFFKACLFLAAGALIHTMTTVSHSGETVSSQDIRNMGGLRKALPVIFLSFCIAGSALAGIPLLSGFISKEAMLSGMVRNVTDWSGWIFIGAFMITSLLTVAYCYRMIATVFFGPERKVRFRPAPVMLVPTLIAAGLSLSFFYSFNPISSRAWFQYVPLIIPENPLIALVSSGWVALSLIAAIIFYRKFAFTRTVAPSPLDRAYDKWIIVPVQRLGNILAWIDDRVIDRTLHRFVYINVAVAKVGGLFDRYVVDGAVGRITRVTRTTGDMIRSAGKGQVQPYLIWALTGFLALIIWILA